MQTVFINGRFLTQRMSGVQRYALEALLALDRRLHAGLEGTDLECVLLAPPGTPPPPLSAIRFREVGHLRGRAWEQLSLARATRGELLFSFTATGPVLKTRQMLTIHDAAAYALPRAHRPRRPSLYELVIGQLGPRVPLVLTVSDFSKRELSRQLGCAQDKVRVTTKGFEHILRQNPDLRVLDAHRLRSKRYVLALDSSTPSDNLALIAQAAARLERPDFELVIAGSRSVRSRASSRLPHLPHLRSIGRVTDAELRALYEHAALFSYPCPHAGFGVRVIEAMACGCPVITSNAATLQDVCGGAAVYVAPDDALGLAHTIQRLMADDGERQRLSRAGKSWVQRYTWNESARLNAAYIRECLKHVS